MRRLACISVLFVVAAACGSGEENTDPAAEDATVTVFAASSLTEAFTELGDAYSAEHPDVEFRFNFLSSSDLATQIEEGAQADVYASADATNMERLVKGGFITGDHPVFARNRLTIVVAPGNPERIGAIENLLTPELVIAVCNPECPAGKYAQEIFDNAGINVKPDSFEADVRAVLTRVALGEADAGIVYVTDVAAAEEDVDTVEIPKQINVIAEYPIGVVEGASGEADGFVDLVTSEQGRAVLDDYGFMSP